MGRTVENLQIHVLIHSGEKPHKCHICDKSFRTVGHLKSHLLFPIIGNTFNGEKCGTCHKVFTQSGSMKTHLLIPIKEKLHNCGVCEKSFKHADSLKRHVLIHR